MTPLGCGPEAYTTGFVKDRTDVGEHNSRRVGSEVVSVEVLWGGARLAVYCVVGGAGLAGELVVAA